MKKIVLVALCLLLAAGTVFAATMLDGQSSTLAVNFDLGEDAATNPKYEIGFASKEPSGLGTANESLETTVTLGLGQIENENGVLVGEGSVWVYYKIYSAAGVTVRIGGAELNHTTAGKLGYVVSDGSSSLFGKDTSTGYISDSATDANTKDVFTHDPSTSVTSNGSKKITFTTDPIPTVASDTEYTATITLAVFGE